MILKCFKFQLILILELIDFIQTFIFSNLILQFLFLLHSADYLDFEFHFPNLDFYLKIIKEQAWLFILRLFVILFIIVDSKAHSKVYLIFKDDFKFIFVQISAIHLI